MVLKSLLSASEWLVEEHQFDSSKLNAMETIFTVGNGYLGTRGALEEGHDAGLAGTYINGIFDNYDSFVIDLVNAPNWSEISVWIEGEKLSLQNCEVLDYYRALDMKQGLLYRSTRFKDRNGRITKYESIRYANFENRNQFEIKISVTPENYSGDIEVDAPINGHVFNLDLEPVYREKPIFSPEVQWDKWTKSKHLKYVDSGSTKNGLFLEMKTIERPYHIIYNSVVNVEMPNARKEKYFDHEVVGKIVRFHAKQGETYQIEKLTTIFTTRDVPFEKIRSESQELMKTSMTLGFEGRLKIHNSVWKKKWDSCDIKITGDESANHAVRFNIYHLLITANEQDSKANVGAKSLSGEGYKGHIFWDTEIFLLPFYIYTQPNTAKSLLLYRYHTLDDARIYANESGCKGARYAWESTDTGLEATPPWTADGAHRIWTGERELHITSAVVYGVVSYYNNTNDIDFLLDNGLEILFETSRFWESRLEYNIEKDRYEINNVEGPDEFHELVNNNVYTNYLTKWSLELSAQYYYQLKTEYPNRMNDLINKIGLKDEEVLKWSSKASKIYLPFDKKKELVEEFEGYFDLKDVPIIEWDKNGMPVYPNGYDHFNSGETTLIKQPDVLMLMYLLPDAFSDRIKKINYNYYEKRTMHKSSLSPSIHTIMGIETGNYERAFQYFKRSAYVDLIDNQGNTNWGMHIASSGGTWQALINGFAGLRVKKEQLTFNPWLPKEWADISFSLLWHGQSIKVRVTHSKMQFVLSIGTESEIKIQVAGKEVVIDSGKMVEVTY